MAKRLAVVAVNPVNGFGLFQYLETFFEKGVSYRLYAVSDDKRIRTNSGIPIEADDTITALKGKAGEYDGLVFACGDAMPVFQQHASEAHNIALLEVLREFSAQGKLMIGHCAAALIFEIAGIGEGKRMAVHPLAKPALQKCIGTDEAAVIDGNFYTAQCEHTIPALMPELLKALL